MTGTVRLLAVGDLLLCGRYDQLADSGTAAAVFAGLGPRMAEADIVVGNLECVLSDAGVPRSDKLCLRGRPAYARVLAEAGFHVLSLANNHSFDYGHAGYADTAAHLRDAGLAALGAGDTAADAAKPIIVERDGVRVGFLAYCHDSTKPSEVAAEGAPGVARLDPGELIPAVQRWAPEVHHLVLLLHWGLEYSPMPTPEQVELGRRAVDAGAAAVIGHHSHMIQGVETYKGRVIAYSLGNCTDSDVDWQGPTRHYSAAMGESDREGLALVLELGPAGARVVEQCPLWLNETGQPQPARGERARSILAKLEERSAALARDDLSRHWEETLVDRRVLGPFMHWWRSGSLWDKVRGFRPSQLRTLWLLASTYVRIRFSRGEGRWSLFNPRNDDRPMPYAGRGGEDERR